MERVHFQVGETSKISEQCSVYFTKNILLRSEIKKECAKCSAESVKNVNIQF